MASMISNDPRTGDLLMAASLDVAPNPLSVLHIGLNLPEN
jgi:hypothetical protein